MHINSLPAELFVQILNHISFGDDMNVMLVNRTWYREYRALVARQAQARFEEILFSNMWNWKECGVPIIRHRNIFYWRNFLVNKLFSFCRIFDDKRIYARLLKTQNALKKEMKETKLIPSPIPHRRKEYFLKPSLSLSCNQCLVFPIPCLTN